MGLLPATLILLLAATLTRAEVDTPPQAFGDMVMACAGDSYIAALPGLAVYLDATYGTHLFDSVSGGDRVGPYATAGRWNDLSGNGNNATQTNAAYRPYYVPTGITRGAVSFDGSNDRMLFTRPIAIGAHVTNVATFVVFARLKPAKINTFFGTTSGGSAGAYDMDWYSNNKTYSQMGAGGSAQTASGITNTGYFVTSVVRTGTITRAYINGLQVAVNATAQGAFATNSLDQFGMSQNAYFNTGMVACIIACTSAYDTAKTAEVTQYLMRKWGIQ